MYMKNDNDFDFDKIIKKDQNKILCLGKLIE